MTISDEERNSRKERKKEIPKVKERQIVAGRARDSEREGEKMVAEKERGLIQS